MFELILGAAGGIIIYEKVKHYNFVIKMMKPLKSFKFTRIVMFNEEEYAVRRGAFGVYFYKDLYNSNLMWHSTHDSDFKDCLKSLERCQEWIENKNKTNGSGTPV